MQLVWRPTRTTFAIMNIRETLHGEHAVTADPPYTGPPMQRPGIALALVFAFALAACGGGGDTTPGAVQTTVAQTSESPETTVGDGSPTTVASVDEATTSVAGNNSQAAPSGVDGPAAPDFSLVLSDGSTFVLSEAAKPVYMVFWAEW